MSSLLDSVLVIVLREMVAVSLLVLALIKFGITGAALHSVKSVHGSGHHHVAYDSLNASEVTGQERTVIAAGALAAGTVVVSLWSSVFSDKAIEIDIANRLTSSFNDPTWYILHGHVAILPPFLINEKDPSTKLLFQKTPHSGFGTEGVVCYQIGSQAPLSLVIMWKMPQFQTTGFFIKIKKGGHIPAENLKPMFNDVDKNKLWFKVNDQNSWQTKKEEGLTWKAAMGTRSLTSLKVIVFQ